MGIGEYYATNRTLTVSQVDAKSERKHPTRCVEFLVGTKNRNELGAIGGPWSRSVDGPDPANDPNVLINTAIRTVRSTSTWPGS